MAGLLTLVPLPPDALETWGTLQSWLAEAMPRLDLALLELQPPGLATGVWSLPLGLLLLTAMALLNWRFAEGVHRHA